MQKFKDMIGKKFGKLLVIDISDKQDATGNLYWVCNCDCGTKGYSVRGSNLRNGHTTSCGCITPAIIEIGNTYGDLTVIGRSNNQTHSSIYWDCRCSCGSIVSIRSDLLRKGTKTYCGDKTKHKNIIHKYIDESGKTYGKLTVLQVSRKGESGEVYWDCVCNCGNKIVVRGAFLRKGKTTSCGCDKLPYIDETGKRYGKWWVIQLSNKKGAYGQVYWDCVCECGNERQVLGTSLRSGHSSSCGCQTDHGGDKTFKNEIGNKYGKLTVISRDYEKKDGKTYWKCSCECGNLLVIRADHLRSGHTESCGCSKTEDLTGRIFGQLTVQCKDMTKENEVYWNCLCSCGKSTSKRGVDLRSGRVQSCSKGCLASNRFQETGINELITRTKQSAKNRGLEYLLTREELSKIISENCFYCGVPPSNEIRTYRTKKLKFKYTGIDRVDSSRGYVLDNVRPCCECCNIAKSNKTEDEFFSWVNRISGNLKSRNVI